MANNQIFVGAPYAVDQGVVSGKIYNYHKTPNTYSWRIRSNQIVIPDVTKIKKAFLYNRSSGKLVTYLDVIDPLQGKIAGPAEEEIKYKTFYDPAVYSVGTGSVTVDSSTAWTGQQVGMLWWDLRTAKFINSYDQDLVYRNSVWNQLAAGASIDIYEWVTTNLKPSQWDAQADTTAGLTSGISGKSLYGDTVYSTKQTYDKISKSFKNIYYFWVKNKAVTPNILGRNMSAQDVASLIQSPRGQGYTYLALTGINTFSLANVKQYLASNDVVLSVEYWTTANTNQNVHNQYKLISNDPNIDLPKTIEQKWIDSLCGIDSAGRLVPDPSLPIKIRYGVENRPRQGMFVNRLEALKEFIEYVNQTLIKNQIVESYNISNLESYDKEPTIITGLYDAILDVNSELSYTNVISFTVPNLTPIITDGRITGITIVNAGRGYINSINGTATSPYIEIVGSGQGAVVKSIINSLGQITGATIISSGEGYDFNTQCIIRSYSVLIHSDSQAGGNWSIYTYDVNSKLWSRTLTQGYDVRNYWAYTDWYGSYTDPTTGRTLFTATKFTAADFLVTTLVDLNTIKSLVGQTVKVRNVGTGGWLLLYKYADSTSIDWTQSYATVGIQNGTIQFSSSLYDFSNTVIGYDSSIFDGESFDVVAGTELRIILDTIKNNILTNELKQEYLNLFFNSVRYTYSEQPYVDWIFKTSFVKAQHNVGALDQPINYPVDNLANFENYIGEVKPYKTKVREYVSNYESLDTAQLPITDFDLMPVFENGSVRLIDTHVIDGKISANDPNIQKYPWKFWLDNVGFTVTSLVLTSGGAGYITEPVVTIVSNSGSGATARAFISNGRVNRIVLLTQGSNYLSAPTVVIDGGLVHGGTAARAVAIIGDSVIRSTSIGMKFDRTSSTNYISQLQQVETFTGTGSLLTFKLKWAPDVRVGTFSVSVNNIPQLRELYTLSIIKNTSVTTAQLPSYTQYSGLLTFNVDYAPAYGSEIVVTYLIDESLLTATDRIEFYYNPTTGQLGKDLNQLMTGIDYGGVIVDGLGFNIQTGWGSLPYYQDKWDSSYNSTFTDFIVTVKADTHSFTLPYVPANGTELNVYHVKNKVEGPFIADGTTLEYNFNILDNNPVVTTVDTQPAYGIQTTYNIDGSYDNVLVVNSASGIVAGMGIVGIGFASNVAVLTITGTSGDGTTATLTFDAQSAPPYTIGQQITVNNILPLAYNGTYIVTACTAGNPNVKPSIPGTVSYASTATGSKTQTGTVKGSNPHTVTSVNLQTNTVILNRNPDSIPSGTLTFTFGFAGSTQISIADTNNINIGDLVQCPSLPTSVFVEGTTVVSKGIDGHTLTLDKLVYSGITYSTPITFTRTLEQPTDLIINANGTFVLTRAIPAGLDIYVTGQMNPERLDSPAYGTPSAPATSIMLPLVSDGIPDNPLPAVPAKTFQIPNTFTVNDGDEFILRQSTSDGAVPPTADSYDTEIAGGDLTSNTTYTELAPYTIDGSYYTARGIVADDIIIDGDGMVTPTTSPAPEEVVPGQVVDTVAIKVYDRPTSGSANIKVDNFIGNGVTTEFVMTQQPNSPQAVIVKVGNEIKTIELDYTVDYQNKTINLKLAPTVGQLVSLFNIGFNGANILDLDFFIGDGVTTEFVTKAPWTTPVTSLVYINGQISNPTLFKTDNTYEFANAIGLKFNSPPPLESLINFIIVNGDQQTFSITNSEIIATDGRPATSGYQLIYPVGNSLPNETNMIVRVDQTILDGPNNSYFTISSNRLNYILDATKVPSYSASIQQINVIADGTLLKLGNDYTIDPSGVTIKITKSTYNTYKGTLLVVSVTTGESYFYNTANRSITFTHVYDNTHQVEVISSYNHTILDIQRTEVTISATTTLVPNTVDYYYYRETLEGLIKLDRSVVNDSSVWVIKNSTLLTPNIDYRLNDDRQSIQLSLIPTIGDKISLITFGSNVLTSGIAYMQFKDMLNRVTYKRLSVNKRTKLAQDLHWNDTQIVVTDASNLSIPNPSRNLPGILEIRGERIEYFAKSGNILSRLRRGTLGTGVYNLNKAGTFVQDIGLSETIPYIETATTEQIVSDGTLIVDLGFVPGGFDTTWTYKGQPMTASDATLLAKSAVEVFAGGIRLKKNPYAVHNVNRAPYSPAGDVNFSEEFAVDGVSRQITLTNTVPKNTQITVIKRTGTVWDSTVNIQNDISKITDFLKSAPGIWYTEYTS